MYANQIRTPEFQVMCNSFLESLLFGSDDEVYDKSFDDCHESVRSYCAGVVAAVGVMVGDMKNMSVTSSQLAHSLTMSILGHETDRELFDDLGILAWVEKASRVELYVGDDGKVYISGKEEEKPFTLKLSQSDGEGRNGCLFTYTGLAVTVEALLCKTLHRLSEGGEVSTKTWVKAYGEG